MRILGGFDSGISRKPIASRDHGSIAMVVGECEPFLKNTLEAPGEILVWLSNIPTDLDHDCTALVPDRKRIFKRERKTKRKRQGSGSRIPSPPLSSPMNPDAKANAEAEADIEAGFH